MTLNLGVNTTRDMREYTLPLYGMRGVFSLSGPVSVPYFMALMDLKRLANEIKTHEEARPSLDTRYSLKELFQRRIDSDRVQRELVNGYLRSPQKLKFFNSLTVALLPKDDAGKPAGSFEAYENNDPPIPDALASKFDESFQPKDGVEKKVFGGVQLVITKTEGISRLRWDRRRVDAVAVDGQHRLKALKLWLQGQSGDLSADEQPTRIPVIFLLLHNEAGLTTGTGVTTGGIKSISREIFTDLNKNAKPVDVATTIILDDLSVEALCVRSIITDSTCVDEVGKLPLSLIRWQEANSRFDTSYFLNSLVNLHLLVKDLLDIKMPDPLEKEDVESFIKNLDDKVGQGEPRKLCADGAHLLDFFKNSYLDVDKETQVIPFNGLPTRFLPNAVEGFQNRFAPWLVPLLRDFKPYKVIIDYAKSNNLIDGPFSKYLSQPEAHRVGALDDEMAVAYGPDWRESEIDRHQKHIEAIKGLPSDPLGEQWAFKALFQKAFIRLGAELFLNAGDDEREKFGSVKDYLNYFDNLHDANILRVKAPLPDSDHGLWSFIAVNANQGNIRVSRASEKRIKSLLLLWYFGLRYARKENKTISLTDVDSDSLISTKSLLDALSRKGAQAHWPNASESYDDLMALFESPNVRLYLSKRDDPSDREVKRNAAARVLQVFSAGFGDINKKHEPASS